MFLSQGQECNIYHKGIIMYLQHIWVLGHDSLPYLSSGTPLVGLKKKTYLDMKSWYLTPNKHNHDFYGFKCTIFGRWIKITIFYLQGGWTWDMYMYYSDRMWSMDTILFPQLRFWHNFTSLVPVLHTWFT